MKVTTLGQRETASGIILAGGGVVVWKLGCHPFPRLKVQLKGPPALTSNCGRFSRRNKEGSTPKA